MDAPRAPTLLLGLGNTLMCDDGVGCLVAREVHRALAPETADLLDGPLVGIDLAAVMEGYERVVILDALVAPGEPAGAVLRVPLDPDAVGDAHPSAHAAGLETSLATLRRLGAELPPTIEVYGIVARHVDRLHEGLSGTLARRLPAVVVRILDSAFSTQGISAR